MRDLAPTLVLLAVVPAACGIDVEVTEESIQHQLRWEQEPGEIQDCHVFKLGNTRNVEVDQLKITFPEGSHHVHLYRSNEPAADAVYDCFKGIDWQKWSLLAGAQTKSMDWKLPEGVTIPLEPHQQLLAQVHWLNTTNEKVESTVDIDFHTTEYSQEHLGVMFGVNKRVDIAPNQRTRIEHFCQMPKGAKLHALMGHFHAHGSNYRVTERMPDQTTGTEIYFAKDEPAFDFQLFSPAHDVPAGAGFQYECSFFNYGNTQLTWGSDTHTQEHCNMTAYFSPAEQISTLCLLEPSKLAALTAAKPTVGVGEDFLFAVELVSPEATDTVVELQSSDPTAITVPASITIPAGQVHAAFTAKTSRPANVEVTATMAGTKVITPVRVTGLVISEVFYNSATGSHDQMQWIEIANASDRPLDLSGYSIGAGSADFLRTRLGLPMTIPARGCIVVGGPESSPANYLPNFAVSTDLSPDLSLGTDQAAGIGLFAATPSAMTNTVRPVDVLVYGGLNQQLQGPDGQIAPVWPGSTPGGSLKRVTNGVWTKSATPTPGNCEVLNVLL